MFPYGSKLKRREERIKEHKSRGEPDKSGSNKRKQIRRTEARGGNMRESKDYSGNKAGDKDTKRDLRQWEARKVRGHNSGVRAGCNIRAKGKNLVSQGDWHKLAAFWPAGAHMLTFQWQSLPGWPFSLVGVDGELCSNSHIFDSF